MRFSWPIAGPMYDQFSTPGMLTFGTMLIDDGVPLSP